MAKLTPTQLANRRAKREADANSRASKTLVAAYTSIYCADDANDFVIDSKGRKVRQGQATTDDIYNLLVKNRVVDTLDGLRYLGRQGFQNLIDNGVLKRASDFSRYKSNNLYWVTGRAVELYGLPKRITLTTGYVCDYAEAA